MKRAALVLLCVAASTGCATTGGVRVGGPSKTAVKAAKLLLGPDADPLRAQKAIAEAARKAPEDPVARYLYGLERLEHGYPATAADAFVSALELIHIQGGDLVGLSATRRLTLLLDLAPQFREKMEPRLNRLFDTQGRFEDPTRTALGELLIELAYRNGDAERVRALAKSLGCIASWTVAGPFGPQSLLGFDAIHPPANQGAWVEAYDLGPGRGRAPARIQEARGCVAHLGRAQSQRGGTTYAKAFVDVDEPGDFSVRLETASTVELSVDGQSIARMDRRARALPNVTYHRTSLSAGQHEIVVKLASRNPNPILGVSLRRSNVPSQRAGRARLPKVLSHYLEIERLVVDGDYVEARARLEAINASKHRSPIVLGLLSEVQFADPLRNEASKRDAGRATLRRLAETDSLSWIPTLQLARLADIEGRYEEALQLLKTGAESWPNVVAFPIAQADVFAARGWRAYQARSVRAAQDLQTDRCAVVSAALSLARSLGQADVAGQEVERSFRCDARTHLRFQHLLETRRWDDARRELDRLAALEPIQHRADITVAKTTLARAVGQDTTPLLSSLRSLRPNAPDAVIALSDLALKKGGRSEAVQVLQEAIDKKPRSMAAARRVRDALLFGHELDEFRLDGKKVIAAFERSGRVYDHPQVLVLDYTVSRVLSDGSMLELTHNIFRAQSDEAVDALGEFSAPPGADLLKLRSIKADGTTLEPDWIAGKESVSLNDLAIGDYVEYEFVRTVAPDESVPGGVRGERFYFRTFDVPFDRSEYVVIVPSNMQVMVDPRGAAPTGTRRSDTDRLILRWRVDHSEPLEQEPASIHMREYIPSIAWGVNLTWQAAVDVFRDGLADRDIADPAAQDLVVSVIRDAKSPRERARLLYDWVMRNVEHSNDSFGLSPAMLHDRLGHRARVLHYLFQLAGLRSQLVLARSYVADQTRTEFPETETYTNLLVALQLDDGAVYLQAEARSAPFGFLPPTFRGQDAITIASNSRAVQLVDTSSYPDNHRVEAKVRLRPDGSAHIAVTETTTGADAVRWREDLRAIPSAELKSRFQEHYLPSVIPNAELKSLEVENASDFTAPLRLVYNAEVSQFARRESDRWYVPTIFRTYASANYARMATRNFTEVIANPTQAQVRVEVRLPQGHSLAERVVAGRRKFSGASFEREVNLAPDGRLILKRNVRIPRMRVVPTSYGSFAAFCRSIDRDESQEIALQVRR